MAQYIDKSALIAEIERRIEGLKDCYADTIEGYAGEISGLKRLLETIDTLEVKEVDLEKELKKKIGNVGECDRRIAEYFFELGLKTKGE